MIIEIALIIPEIDKRCPLSSGVYLVRGLGAEIVDAEFNIHIENESIEDKHALIFVEADGIAICDLDTRSGTFIGGQRLPALTKHAIALEDQFVSIRFGNVDGKLTNCSTLEQQHHSSGFHEESMHLVLEKSSEPANLTIPETQMICPDKFIPSPSSKDNSSVNISADISIPETQEVFNIAAMSFPIPNRAEDKEDEVPRPLSPTEEENLIGNQFCISSQELNEVFEDDNITNSRDLLDDLNWVTGDGEGTAIKRPEGSDPPVASSNAAEIEFNKSADSVANEQVKESSAEQKDDSLRSQTHTPDLFNVELLEKFETKETRMNNAKASRAQNEESKGNLTDDESSRQCITTASEKALSNGPISSTPSGPNVDENLDVSKTPPLDLLTTSSTPKIGDHGEDVLFEGVALEVEARDVGHTFAAPLQHTNKENMLIGVEASTDQQPTQVYVRKKSVKPPVEPLQIPTNPAHDFPLASDLEPTQLFKPKKKNFKKVQAARKTVIAADEKDLEPTQKYVPKKTKSTHTPNEIENNTSNSTMVQSEQSATPKTTVQAFFAEMEGGKPNTHQPDSPDMSAFITLTPEFLGNAFAEENIANSSALRKVNRLETDSDDDDSLTQLLKKRRIDNDFSSLLNSIKMNEQNCTSTVESGEKEGDLLEKYTLRGQSDSPEKNNSEKGHEKKESPEKGKSGKGHEKVESSEKSISEKGHKKKESSEKSYSEKGHEKNEIPEKNNSEKGHEKNEIPEKSISEKGQEKKESPEKGESRKGHEKKGIPEKNNSEKGRQKIEIPQEGKSGKGHEKVESPEKSISEKGQEKKESPEKSISEKGHEKKGIPEKNNSEKGHEKIEKRDLRERKTAASEEPAIEHKLAKAKSENKGAVKSKIKKAESLASIVEQPSTSTASGGRATRSKRAATVDIADAVVAPKIKRTESLRSVAEHTSRGRSSRQTKLQAQSKSIDEKRQRSTSNSRSSSEKKNDGVEKTRSTSAGSRSNESTSAGKKLKVEIKREELPKRRVRTKTESSETAADNDISTKATRPQLKRKAKEEPSEFKTLELTPPIITSQALRTRSRMLSQELKPESACEECDELPTTSRAAARAMLNNKASIDGKSVLKLSFTMVHPDKKLELLKYANSKWEEVQNPEDSQILVMDHGNRTLKFLVAVAKGIPIVTSKWVEAINSTGVVSIRSNYFLKDFAFEKSFKFALLRTLTHAKKAKLFTNFQFLMTSNLTPTPSDMKVIINCAGGTVLERENIPEQTEDRQLYLISSEKDRPHWHGYRRQITNLCITSTEAVMIAIMRYDAKILKTQGY